MHEGTWRTSFVFITDSLLPNRRVNYIGVALMGELSK